MASLYSVTRGDNKPTKKVPEMMKRDFSSRSQLETPQIAA